MMSCSQVGVSLLVQGSMVVSFIWARYSVAERGVKQLTEASRWDHPAHGCCVPRHDGSVLCCHRCK